MSLGSGCERRVFSCCVADGVSVIAALRGRNLLRGLEVEVGLTGVASGVEVVIGATGLGFCALASVRLMLTAPPCDWLSCWPVNLGGLVSFNSGIPPAMDVSGTPVFRGGGGGSVLGVCGRWTVAV